METVQNSTRTFIYRPEDVAALYNDIDRHYRRQPTCGVHHYEIATQTTEISLFVQSYT